MQTALCPKLPLICKYCGAEHPASDMSEHEAACGAQREQCGRCEAWVTVKDWDKHMSQRHGVLVQRSPNRMRKPITLQGMNKQKSSKPGCWKQNSSPLQGMCPTQT